jgi:hypothetical protein
MKLIKSKKGMALLAAVAAVGVAAFGAYAYFSSTGTGSGSANAGANDTSITLYATLTDGLVPGTSKSVSFTADNASLTTTGYVATIKFGSVSSSNPACQTYLTANQADFTMQDVAENTPVHAAPGGNGTVMPHDATLSWLNNDSVNQTPCANQPLTLNVTSV